MTANQARQSIKAFATGARQFVVAETKLGSLPGASGSIKFLCAGGQIYVAKGTRNKIGLVAEHVVARLGQLLEAPVGDVTLLEVPDALRADAQVLAMGPGPAHAIKWIENITDRGALTHFDVPANRDRFASLCTLYSLAGAGDHQLFYSTTEPRLVHSLDHGHFFPGGPNWTAASLTVAAPATLDRWFAPAGLTSAELASVRLKLEAITDGNIADILAGPPAEWPFTQEQRDALGSYLRTRRDTLLTLIPQA